MLIVHPNHKSVNQILCDLKGQPYKLIQYDIDGESKEIGPFTGSCEGNEVFIYPNPVDDVLNISATGYQHATISILDFTGRTIYQQILNLEST
ncbi:MAG: T9SS type A sorting domain-containing protein [Crocinitomicaceae bacterium]|nr:T9SS type A sorting domain-containing protein [Crocinitomicaceae bacterium]